MMHECSTHKKQPNNRSVYITNLEDDIEKNGTKLNEEEGPKDKKPAVKIGILKGPP